MAVFAISATNIVYTNKLRSNRQHSNTSFIKKKASKKKERNSIKSSQTALKTYNSFA